MVGLIRLLGAAMVAIGAIYLVKPSTMKKWLNFWAKENRLQMAAVLNLVIGIIFLAAASKCAVPWIIVIFGILSLAKGILLFVLGKKKMLSMIEGFAKKPIKALRIYALLALSLGFLLIYSA